MATQTKSNPALLLTEEQIHDAAKVIVSSENPEVSLKIFAAALPAAEVEAIKEAVASAASEKAYAAMLPQLKKDHDVKKSLKVYALIEEISSLMVEITDVHENRVGGGNSMEHTLKNIGTAFGTVKIVLKP